MGYRVWTCKLVVDDSKPLPRGFDGPPRDAAVEAVERAGFEVVSMFSGWAGQLTEMEKKIVDERGGPRGTYVTGLGPSKRA